MIIANFILKIVKNLEGLGILIFKKSSKKLDNYISY